MAVTPIFLTRNERSKIVVCLLRPVLSVVTVLFFVALVGCGADGYEPVTGTVTYSDGTFPTSEMAIITFEPKEGGNARGTSVKGASGDIGKDGKYELTTIDPGDGAKPGDYIVTVRIMDGYPDPVFAVAKKYTDILDTPLTAKVEAGGENNFDFKVERP
jgi:hypothetical protein